MDEYQFSIYIIEVFAKKINFKCLPHTESTLGSWGYYPFLAIFLAGNSHAKSATDVPQWMENYILWPPLHLLDRNLHTNLPRPPATPTCYAHQPHPSATPTYHTCHLATLISPMTNVCFLWVWQVGMAGARGRWVWQVGVAGERGKWVWQVGVVHLSHLPDTPLSHSD